MLTVSTIVMAAYGLASAGWAAVDLVRGGHLEWWADAGLVLFGLLLVLSAALVRVRLPGGLAAAVGAMLGLQALSVHNAVHLDYGITGQVLQGALATSLVVLARAGSLAAGGADRAD
jgi:hypothetical protein